MANRSVRALFVSLSVVLIFFHCSNTTSGTGEKQPQEAYKEGELLVKFKPGVSESAKKKTHERLGSIVIKEFSSIRVQHVRLKKGLKVEEAIQLYQNDPLIEYAEPVHIMEIQ